MVSGERTMGGGAGAAANALAENPALATAAPIPALTSSLRRDGDNKSAHSWSLCCVVSMLFFSLCMVRFDCWQEGRQEASRFPWTWTLAAGLTEATWMNVMK